ncbi:Macrolide export ATP-binding/permease protein MacB [Candidatus Calditenuaceae archaeon HR02]|nr:Macrolide export ATP-binding/permease protein MacB [Candidatus Calditenuaceae archaeon HR02]
MRLLDTARYAFSALRERRGRSVLTILGIAIGSGLIIALVSMGEGINTTVTGRLLLLGANNIIILPAQGSNIQFTDADVQRISVIPEVTAVAPFYSAVAEFYVGGVKVSGRILGIDPLQLQIIFPGIKILEGETPPPTSASQVSVGYKVAFPPAVQTTSKLYVGQPIVISASTAGGIKTGSFTVTGIYDRFGASLFFDADSAVVMPLPAARKLLGQTSYQAILVNTERIEAVDYIISELERMYGRSVNIISPTTILQTVRSIIASFTIFLALIASVSLLVAGLGIMNTMIMSVMERTREIGILRSIGMTRREVLFTFLFEAVLTGLVGGLIGLGLGTLLSIGFGRYAGNFLRFGPQFEPLPLEPAITPQLLIGTLLFAILVGSLSGLYPARRAAQVDPVRALRTE